MNVVLAGDGPVQELVNGKVTKTLQAHGTPTLYSLVDDPEPRRARVEIRPTPGVEAFSFTFG